MYKCSSSDSTVCLNWVLKTSQIRHNFKTPCFGENLYFFSYLTLDVATSFDDVWCVFFTRLFQIWYFLAKLQILCQNNVCVLIHKDSVTTGLEVIKLLRTKFTLWYKKCNQSSVTVVSKSVSNFCKLLLIRPIRTPCTVWRFKVTSAFPWAIRNSLGFASCVSRSSTLLFDIATLHLIFEHNFVTHPELVLSLIFGNFSLYRRTAFEL